MLSVDRRGQLQYCNSGFPTSFLSFLGSRSTLDQRRNTCQQSPRKESAQHCKRHDEIKAKTSQQRQRGIERFKYLPTNATGLQACLQFPSFLLHPAVLLVPATTHVFPMIYNALVSLHDDHVEKREPRNTIPVQFTDFTRLVLG